MIPELLVGLILVGMLAFARLVVVTEGLVAQRS